jgi:hypothetical protein
MAVFTDKMGFGRKYRGKHFQVFLDTYEIFLLPTISVTACKNPFILFVSFYWLFLGVEWRSRALKKE